MGSAKGKRPIKVMKPASWRSLETFPLDGQRSGGCKLKRALEVRRWSTVSYLKFQIDS